MELSALIPTAFTEATGQPYTGSTGDNNWNRMLLYIQLNLSDWAHEGGGKWESLYSPGISSGTITATDTFSLSGFLNVSNKAHDYAYILWIDGVTVSRYKTVPGPQLKDYRTGHRAVFVAGVSKVIFSQPFSETDGEFGGTLYVPGYSMPPVPSEPTDIPQIDDPYYLVFMAAQDWCQPDVTLVQNVPSLISKANNSMTNMKLANQRMKTQSQQAPLQGAGRGETW